MDGLGPFCCQNSGCPDVGKRGHGNLTVTSRYGAGKARRMLRCSTRKEKENNRVVRVSARVVLGTAVAVARAVAASAVGRVVSTSVVGRHNGTDRGRCHRTVRKSYAFSKDGDVHRAATVFNYFSYNFCWPVRTRRGKGEDGRRQKRTPALAAGLTDHVGSLAEWPTYPARHVQRKEGTTA